MRGLVLPRSPARIASTPAAGLREASRFLAAVIATGFGIVLGTNTSKAQVTIEQYQRDVANKSFDQQLVTLIAFTAVPGITSGTLTVRREAPVPDYELAKTAISTDQTFPLENRPFDLFLEGAVGYAETDEKSFDLRSIGGTPIVVQTDRTVAFGRVGLGPSIPLGGGFLLRPTVSLAISRFKNETGLGAIEPSDGSIGTFLTKDFELWGATYSGSLQLRFDDLVGPGRLEAEGTLTPSFTEIIDAPIEQLEVSGWNTTATLRTRWSQMTEQTVLGQPLGWNVFSTATLPMGDGRGLLGFRYVFELGAGLDLDLGDRDLAPVEAFRPNASVLFGDNVSGFSIGASFRF